MEIRESTWNDFIDTRPVTERDQDGKYHHFCTILRQHNITRRETAFEVLVNLFLAKIVDEEENKTDLKFRWKGVAYDNYFDFVDRLQGLYQIGMKKFLNDEITYISNEQIDSAFWTVKNKRNATKKTIQSYFRKLKFFSNNAFSFLNVHNERLFNKNCKVLVEIVQMWENLRLKTEDQNQFLGDMFEYFLDNSIKQSEGQFFTPLPVCKFIIMSLPLELKINESKEPVRAIDYACGAGHFLTEYAHQIKPLVSKYKQIAPTEYYKNIFGVEKEDRLAKVAKVAAYMYGQEQIKIIEEDALIDLPEIKGNSFDVLVANPPFAVKGFLQNLSDEQKEQYELYNTTISNRNTNNIQCFFIERLRHLMAPDGVVGIIVPSSILTNADSTHIMTREILLKFFDLISIVELGSGTFGKTGTNTVILFLRRKAQKPEPAEHFKNRVDDFFEGIKDNDRDVAEYQDLHLVKKYCEHIEVSFDDYKLLFGLQSDKFSKLDRLFEYTIFIDYKQNFDNNTEIKNLKARNSFRNLEPKLQEAELCKRFIHYTHSVEKEKLFYFILAYENKQRVLIVKNPTNSKEQKQFLGYDWSGAKGSEGIKYLNGNTVNDMVTPLFDPQNANNDEKINFLIQENFLGKEHSDSKVLKRYEGLIHYTDVINILDFSQVAFNKGFSLSSTINLDVQWSASDLGGFNFIFANVSEKAKNLIENEYRQIKEKSNITVRLNNADIFDISIGRRVITKEIEKTTKGIPVYSANVFEPFGFIEKSLLNDFDTASVLWGIDGDWMVNFIEKGNPFYPTDHCGVIRVKGKTVHPRYFSWILEEAGKNVRFSRTHRASTARIKVLSITVPSYKLQEEFVQKIEKFEQQIIKAKGAI